jgi:peptidoglycan/xylan/chitin deacetylase (PgdA/CDA1 family)
MKIIKKIGAPIVLGILFAVIPAVSHAATSTNLIANPSFTATTTQGAGIVPLGWQNGSWGAASGAVFTYPAPGEDDNFAAQVSVASYNGVGEGNGAAEWYFKNVPATPGALYSFSDWYKSTATSYLIIQWTLTNGAFAYDNLPTLPSTNGLWVNTPAEIFSAPLNASSVTILHLLQSAGSLTVDNYSLTPYASTSANALAQPMASLTFDDGYTSQYNNALPILNAAHAAGTFYVITDDIAASPDNLFNSSQVSTGTVSATSKVTWAGLYVDPTDQNYVFSETYTATATSTVTASYTLNGQAGSMTLGALPPATNAPATFTFTLPVNTAGGTVSPISILQTLNATGTLTASAPSLTEAQLYMDRAHLLSLQAAGNEIDSHTETHPDLTGLSLASDTTEISGSRTALENIGATPVNTLAYPFGDYNANVEGMVNNAGYAAARTVDVGYNGAGANTLALKTYSVVASTTFPMVKAWIDAAVANHWWLILTFHDIDPANVITQNGETYGATPQMLQQIVSYLQSQNVSIATMDKALAILKNTVPPSPPSPPSPPAASTSTVTVAVTDNNTNGGTASPSAFTLTVMDGTSTLYHGSAAASQKFSLNVGTSYAITEATTTLSSGYTISLGTGCAGTVTTTSAISCAITNTYAPPSASLIQITPTALPNGTVGSRYSASITASTTTAGIFLWNYSGLLPPGLTVNIGSISKTVTISGTPALSGTYSFTLTVTRGSASAKQAYTVVISPAPHS